MDYYLSNKLLYEIMEEVESYLDGSKKSNDFHLLRELLKLNFMYLEINRSRRFEEEKKDWSNWCKKRFGELNYHEYKKVWYVKGGSIKMKKKYWL